MRLSVKTNMKEQTMGQGVKVFDECLSLAKTPLLTIGKLAVSKRRFITKQGNEAYMRQQDMLYTFFQLRRWAKSLDWYPPIIVSVDIEHHIEAWEGFCGDWGTYGNRIEIPWNNRGELFSLETPQELIKLWQRYRLGVRN